MMVGVDTIALLISLLALLASLANAGYLGLLGAAASKRAGAAEITQHVRGRAPVAAGTTVASLLAVLVADGSIAVNVLAVLLAGGAGGVAARSLQSTRSRYNTPR